MNGISCASQDGYERKQRDVPLGDVEYIDGVQGRQMVFLSTAPAPTPPRESMRRDMLQDRRGSVGVRVIEYCRLGRAQDVGIQMCGTRYQ